MPKGKWRPLSLMGRTIVDTRRMTVAELEREGWDVEPGDEPPLVLVLDNGTMLYPSRDWEGNGPGCLFGTDQEGRQISIL
jgi:hypothetical protein